MTKHDLVAVSLLVFALLVAWITGATRPLGPKGKK